MRHRSESPVCLVGAGLLHHKKGDTAIARENLYLNYGLLDLATILHEAGYQARMLQGNSDEPSATVMKAMTTRPWKRQRTLTDSRKCAAASMSRVVMAFITVADGSSSFPAACGLDIPPRGELLPGRAVIVQVQILTRNRGVTLLVVKKTSSN